ncbi:hypothetical protein [Euzebya tangerina]|uniref:hypothetical protein n=1 Tax=Euzebya tangerina TaxID=591198 RepID=UPI000E31033E|nr:hypothetical protein [Euzebya tangerina]
MKRFDYSLWEHVWEQNLTHVERHTIAMAVWRLQPPASTFEFLVAHELAHRWRRHAVFLVGLYGMWTLFWGAIASGPAPDGTSSPVAMWCAVVGVVAIAACLVVRAHIGRYVRTVRQMAFPT